MDFSRDLLIVELAKWAMALDLMEMDQVDYADPQDLGHSFTVTEMDDG